MFGKEERLRLEHAYQIFIVESAQRRGLDISFQLFKGVSIVFHSVCQYLSDLIHNRWSTLRGIFYWCYTLLLFWFLLEWELVEYVRCFRTLIKICLIFLVFIMSYELIYLIFCQNKLKSLIFACCQLIFLFVFNFNL